MKIKLKGIKVTLKRDEVYAVIHLIRGWKEYQQNLIRRGIDMGEYGETLLKILDKWDKN